MTRLYLKYDYEDQYEPKRIEVLLLYSRRILVYNVEMRTYEVMKHHGFAYFWASMNGMR